MFCHFPAAPKPPQEGQDRPKMPQRPPQDAPRAGKSAPGKPQDRLKTAQDRSKIAQGRPRASQEQPKSNQDHPKSGQEGFYFISSHENAPKSPKKPVRAWNGKRERMGKIQKRIRSYAMLILVSICLSLLPCVALASLCCPVPTD